jgi:hypothetical protein
MIGVFIVNSTLIARVGTRLSATGGRAIPIVPRILGAGIRGDREDRWRYDARLWVYVFESLDHPLQGKIKKLETP